MACGSDDASVIRASSGLSLANLEEDHMHDNHDARQEVRLRSRARRMGYRLCGSRQRVNVPNLDNLGEFMVIEADRNCVVFGQRFDATLDEVEAFLTG
jgi:hypothetical protein